MGKSRLRRFFGCACVIAGKRRGFCRLRCCVDSRRFFGQELRFRPAKARLCRDSSWEKLACGRFSDGSCVSVRQRRDFAGLLMGP